MFSVFRAQFMLILSLNIYFALSAKSLSKNPSKSNKKQWYDDDKCYSQNFATICEENYAESLCHGSKISYPFAPLSHITSIPSSYTSLFGDYSGLPGCWTLFTELVCSIQFAPCVKNKVKLVPRALCTKTLNTCGFLNQTHLWPVDVGDCTDSTIFGESCPVVDAEEKFQWNLSTTKICLHPLVYSKFEDGHYIPHCAFNCTSHWLTQSEHEHINQVVSIVSISAFFVNMFTLITLSLANWERMTVALPDSPITNFASFPLKMYLFSNCMATFSWIVQYTSDVRKLSMCRDDGSLRRFEMAKSSQVGCGLQFFSFYMGIIGASYWLCVFAYFLNLYGDKEKNIYENIKNNKTLSSWWHIGWFIPFAAVCYFLAATKIEADGISGICFIGYSEPLLVFIFVYGPIGVFWFITLGLFFRALCRRNSFNGTYVGVNADDSLLKCKKVVYPVFQLAFLCLIQSSSFAVSLFLQIKHTFMEEIMNQSFFNYLKCQLTHVDNQECKLENRPDVRLIEMHLLMFFVCVLFTDVLILIGGNILFIWKEVAKRCLRCRSLLNKPAPQLVNDKQTDAESNCDAKSQSNISSATSNFGGSHRSHKSKKRFIKKMNSRTSSHRENCSFSHTPSSLKSGSLPTGMNFSMTELSFDDLNKKPKLPPYWMNPYAQWGYGAPQPWPMFYPQFSPAVSVPTDSAYLDGRASSRGMTESKVKSNDVGNKQSEKIVAGSPHQGSMGEPASAFPMKYCYYPPMPHQPNPWFSMYPTPWMNPHMNESSMYLPPWMNPQLQQQAPPADISVQKEETVSNKSAEPKDEKPVVDETEPISPVAELKSDSRQTETTLPIGGERNEEHASCESDFSSDNESFTSSNFDEDEEEFVRKKLAQLSLEKLAADR